MALCQKAEGTAIQQQLASASCSSLLELIYNSPHEPMKHRKGRSVLEERGSKELAEDLGRPDVIEAELESMPCAAGISLTTASSLTST